MPTSAHTDRCAHYLYPLPAFYSPNFSPNHPQMKYLVAFLFILATISVSAQSSRMSISETMADDHYEFKVKVDKSRLADLQWCYNKLTGQPKTRTISGVATYEKDGLTIELNTWKKRILLYTDAVNDAAVASAKENAKVIKDKLKAPKTPKKHTDDWKD